MRYSIISDQVDEDLERALAICQWDGLGGEDLTTVLGKT